MELIDDDVDVIFQEPWCKVVISPRGQRLTVMVRHEDLPAGNAKILDIPAHDSQAFIHGHENRYAFRLYQAHGVA
jgi:hypothetical protein